MSFCQPLDTVTGLNRRQCYLRKKISIRCYTRKFKFSALSCPLLLETTKPSFLCLFAQFTVHSSIPYVPCHTRMEWNYGRKCSSQAARGGLLPLALSTTSRAHVSPYTSVWAPQHGRSAPQPPPFIAASRTYYAKFISFLFFHMYLFPFAIYLFILFFISKILRCVLSI